MLCSVLTRRAGAVAQGQDEAEHSLELHLPYLRHVLGGEGWALVPILVGALSRESERRYGQLLAPYLHDPHTLFVVSSDFCHWGARFRYVFYDKRFGDIHESVEALDLIQRFGGVTAAGLFACLNLALTVLVVRFIYRWVEEYPYVWATGRPIYRHKGTKHPAKS